MTLCYFSIGTTLANMVNVETIIRTAPPHVLPSNRVPLLGANRRVTLDNRVVRTGAVNVPLQWDIMSLSELDAFTLAYWGYSSASAALFVTAIDETGHYSPFAVTLERPYQGDNYQIDAGWARQVSAPGLDWRLQSTAKTSSATITTGERLVFADTTGGSVTLTLPAATAPAANTVFSFVKTAAANSLIIQRAGSDTIGGANTVTLTALNARLDIVSDGGALWTAINA